MMVNAYRKSKKMSIGMYYSKDYLSRRRNDCYTYNKYKGYNYYYKLHNHGKMVGSEVQDGQKGREKEKGEERGDGKRNVEKEEGHNKKIVYVKNGDNNNRRMSKGCKEKENVETKEKKKELEKKKCIIKILKRPTVVAKNETNISKSVGDGNTNNGNTNVEKEKHNNFMNGELKKDVEDAKKEKSGKKKAASKILTKEKKNKDGFKFTSTQELFNLLLKDVKEDNTASNEEETLLTRSDMVDSTKKRSNQSKTELNNKVVRMKTETKNDEEEGEKKNKKKKITKEGVDNKRRYDGNNAIGSCMIGEKDDSVKKANGSGEGQQGGAVIDKVIALRGKAAMTSSSSGNGGGKCYTQKKVENDSVVNGKKILKLLKGMESNKCYATKKAVGGGENNYVKFSSSNYPSSVANSSLPKHASKVDLCKSSSLKNGDLKKIKKEEEEGLFVIPLYMRSPKPEQIPIPVYLSEDVLKRVENVEGGESASGSNGREEKNGGSFPETNVNVFLDRENAGTIGGGGGGGGGMAPVEISPSKMHKDKATMSQIGKAKNYGKIVRDAVNLNQVNNGKEKEIGLNFAKRNAEKKKKKTYLNKKYQHISFNLEHNNLKLNYDVLDLGNVKSSNKKGYNVHSTSPYGKTSNYNYGCNLHKSGKNFKVDKYFYNRKYKVKTAYLSDGQRSKNFYLLKNVKIAAY
ncbi:conserved Plasmodium protein, unknown function [Plasmodium ovale wallikeri]|uniref:Uncharacterized protein n=2 Tax=Plasmodium ovale TaxID=36330 RepID=A0A1A8YND8_PLAOA|nr:conserved Plasmodium protein, unknown function [Plasmodium ovale wallikeri]SBT33022.1 conserved Plasmodium protein, unknown function [Plasmodium ovale wallikeri]SBT75953.1 conserved Plasmodium protein, unknown function [Plasmodium ovale]